MMRYASVCDGIGAVHVAWPDWQCAWTSEIEKFPIAVVEHHWQLPNLGDMTTITERDLEQHGSVDLLVGGTPCQSFSVAGLRKGLADPRGNLALRFVQLAGAMRPTWLLWENVPGVLSVAEGRAFGAFLGGLAKLGYGFAYRILDAQFFGVPQRRRRVFVVGHLGDWRRAAAVLFERDSLCGHPPPSREAGAKVAGAVTQRIDRGGVNSEGNDGHLVAHTLRGEGFDASEDGTGRGTPLVTAYQCHGSNVGPMGTLRGGNGHETGGVPFVFDTTQVTSPGNYSNPKPGDPSHPLASGQHPPAVAYRTSGNSGVMEQGDRTAALNCNTDPNQQIVRRGMTVRRLTPRECERLQGFPDDFTRIRWRNKPAEDCPDGLRYRAIGNSMAVPVMRWIGQRILNAERKQPSP